MSESTLIQVEEPTQIAEARRRARELAGRLELDSTRIEQIAIVVTEAATNLLKHAGHGEILLRAEDTERGPVLEVMALDHGPGMNLDQCLLDGFSTGGSAGQGLGAIRRLSGDSDFYSVAAKGTALVARWSPARLSSPHERPELATLQIGVVNLAKPRQEVSGDSWGEARCNGGWIFMVADGLGHGSEARIASLEAVRILRQNPDLSPAAMLERVHQALRSTRGAAVSVARIDRERAVVTFAGAGNVAAQIYSSSRGSRHNLVSVNGTAGLQMHRLQEFKYAWPDDGVLVLHSDGLSSSTGLEPYPRLQTRDASLIAGVLYRDFSRKHDDATVMVVKAA